MDQHEEQEFASYFRARRDAVRRSAYLLCGDWHRADDLAQTAFVALHRRWRKVRDRGALDAYVRRTVTRAVIDEARRPWRRERFTDEPPEPHPDPGAFTEAVVERDTLLAALATVPPRQRAALVLRFFEDADIATTAQALGCSEGTVKSQTARGLATLRAALAGAGAGAAAPSTVDSGGTSGADTVDGRQGGLPATAVQEVDSGG